MEAAGAVETEAALVEALRRGEEEAFATLVGRYHAPMIRVASMYVGSRAVAEEVAQETWLAVLDGIGRFEQRSSLKTWLFRILTNRAKTRAERERRTIPLSALERPELVPEPAVAADRFLDGDHPRWPGHWATPPRRWDAIPDERLEAAEARACIARAIEDLPPSQRAVITLRDLQGWEPDEVCETLALTDGNQRVLLHRARSTVRAALEAFLEEAA
jgi:RNA polymerase sigma-70 factor (ECF subfamily)